MFFFFINDARVLLSIAILYVDKLNFYFFLNKTLVTIFSRTSISCFPALLKIHWCQQPLLLTLYQNSSQSQDSGTSWSDSSWASRHCTEAPEVPQMCSAVSQHELCFSPSLRSSPLSLHLLIRAVKTFPGTPSTDAPLGSTHPAVSSPWGPITLYCVCYCPSIC